MDNFTKIVYDTLKEKHLGKENSISESNLAVNLGIKSNRELRTYFAEINSTSDKYFKGIVSTSGSIYLCDTAEEVDTAIRTTWRQALSLIKKARNMEKKAGRQGQVELQDGEFKVYMTFGEDNENRS